VQDQGVVETSVRSRQDDRTALVDPANVADLGRVEDLGDAIEIASAAIGIARETASGARLQGV
jgi:hypothetical protein